MKFGAWSQRFAVARQAYAERVGPQDVWSVADHWPLYCGTYHLARYLGISDLVRSTLHVPGDVAELGCWRGASLLLMAKVLRIHNEWGLKVVHGFDSFEGLQSLGPNDAAAAGFEGHFQGSLEELNEMIRLHELRGHVEIHAGRIEQTLPALLEARPELSFSLVYCDADLYQPTATALDLLPSRIVPGGVIAFDQWNVASFPGEGIAVNEVLDRLGGSFEVSTMAAAPQPTLVLRKR